MRIAVVRFGGVVLLLLVLQLSASTASPGGASEMVNIAPPDTSVVLTKDEIIGDDNPSGDIVHAGIEDVNTVTNTINGSGDLTLSIAGPVSCYPHWVNPLDAFPSQIGGTQTSVVTIPGASGVVVAGYSVTCPDGGPYDINITSHLSPSDGEDTTNNLDENWVQIIVTCDADGDGVCTPMDNCPAFATAWSVPTADSDCDGFPDATTVGPRGLESFIGTDSSDRCPDDSADNAWPPDVNNSGGVGLQDVVAFGPSFDQIGPNPPNPLYNPRFDINASGGVTLADIVAMGPFFNKSCTP
jgi:hypothetical protein